MTFAWTIPSICLVGIVTGQLIVRVFGHATGQSADQEVKLVIARGVGSICEIPVKQYASSLVVDFLIVSLT